jgi:hypothetical protein
MNDDDDDDGGGGESIFDFGHAKLCMNDLF